MAQSTGTISINPANGQVQLYVPSNVTRQGTGNSNVSLGQVLNVPSGTVVPIGATWTLISGSFEATSDSQVQQVTVTPA